MVSKGTSILKDLAPQETCYNSVANSNIKFKCRLKGSSLNAKDCQC